MTSLRFGFKGFVAPDMPTLATVLVRLDQAADLKPAARADLKSAVRTTGRVLGMPLDAVPAHPGFLGPKLAAVVPIAHDLEVRRWANARSLLYKALDIAGIKTMPGRYMAPYSPAWRAKYQTITDRSIRLGLNRKIHFYSAQGIEPEDVNDATAADFLRGLKEESRVKDPYRVWRDALTCWNRAVLEVRGWPQQTLAVPPLTQRYGVGPDCFPESFRNEVEAWLARLAGGKFLEQSAFRPLRPSTVRSRRAQIREVVSAQVARGRDPATITSLAAVVQPAAVTEAMRFFHERANKSREDKDKLPTDRMKVLCRVIISIARHWAKLPPEQIKELREIARQCTPPTHGLTAKNRAMLRCFSTKKAKLKLTALPFTVLAGIKPAKPRPKHDALTIQTALLLRLLLRAPMRISNIAGLRFDRHVTQPGGPNGKLVLVIPPEETKNQVELVYPLFGRTIELWQHYLEHARPRLTPGASPFLFPSQGDPNRARSTRAIAEQIGRATRHHLGIRLTPHQFRHLAAKFLLDARPGCYELVRALLGDRSIATIINAYAGMEQEAAVDHYDQVMAELEEEDR